MRTLLTRPELNVCRASTLLFSVALALVVGVLAVSFSQTFRTAEKISAQRIEATYQVHNFAKVIDQYREMYGVEPPTNTAQLVKVLSGDNPRKIAFIVPAKQDLNKRGGLIDPWRLPYLIEPREGKSWHIWSCGQDRINEQGSKTSDDIASWPSK